MNKCMVSRPSHVSHPSQQCLHALFYMLFIFPKHYWSLGQNALNTKQINRVII